MSDGLALVRFADGEVRVAYFASDPGYVVPLLFAVEDAHRVMAAGPERIAELADLAASSPQPTDAESVSIVILYGEERSWDGSASRSAGLLIDGTGPEIIDADTMGIVVGLPAWAESWDSDVIFAADEDELVHPAAQEFLALMPAPSESVPRALVHDEMFMDAAESVMAGSIDGLVFERMLEGLLQRAGDDPEQLRRRLRRILPTVENRLRSGDYMVSFAANGVRELLAHPLNNNHLEYADGKDDLDGPGLPTPRYLLEHRGQEIMVRLRSRQPVPLLSMPTEPSGRIAPAILDNRLEEVPDLTNSQRDLIVAELRAGRRATTEPVYPDWFSATTYRSLATFPPTWMQVLASEEFAVVRTTRLAGSVYPLMWPHDPARGIASMLAPLVGDLNRSPSWSGPAFLGGFCAWLATADVPVTEAGAITCALGISARAELNSTPALTLLSARADDPRWVAEWIPRALALLISTDTAKVRRLCDNLGRWIDTDADVVLNASLALIAQLATAGRNDLHVVITLAADAAQAAGPTVTVPPPALVELANTKGSTKALREARRLISLLAQ